MQTNARPPVRLGIIGCGNVLTAYGPVIQQMQVSGRVEATWACGRQTQRDFATRELGNVRFSTAPEEVIRSSEVDGLVILTSMPEHGHLVKAGLEAGKHVFVEKPLATSLDDAEKVVAHAQNAPGILVCAPFVVLSPTFQIISRRIRSGDIGKPCSARARYGWSGPWWNEWFYKPGGGCLLDLGVYCITSLTGLLGPAKRVAAFTGVAIPEREVNGRKTRVEADDNAQVLLDFGGACFGAVMSGFTLQQYRCPAVEVYGTTGTIQMLGDDWDPDGYELWQNDAGCWQTFKETHPDWLWSDGLRHFVDCIHERKRPLATPEHALHVLEIMLKATQASGEGRTLDIKNTFEPPIFAEPALSEAAHLMHDRSRKHQ